jgi:CRISPR type III-B/RAMP module-associated protein Cmr5
MSGIQTIGQRYAQAAWQCVNRRVGSTHEIATDQENKRYRARCRSLPVMIHQCGLAQTLAFCQSRNSASGDPYQYGAWLADIVEVLGKQTSELLAEESRKANLQTYMHLTHQVLHAASWLKNYAEASIETGDDNDDDGRGEE